jgi:hypothetical protein
MRPLRSCWAKGSLGLVLLFGLGIAMLVIASHISRARYMSEWSRNQLPFDQTVWIANPDSTEMNPIRLRMVDDLLTKHNFLGMSRKQIDDLLGPRAPTDKFQNWDLVYWLGPERGSFRLDSEWLVFRFDNDGRVKEFKHLRD